MIGIAVRIGMLSTGFLGLYLISGHNYLLFHCLVEGLCIVVSAGIFVIAWNARRYMGNDFFLLLGVAFLFVALLDFLHALSYKGMGIFPDGGNYATQLWIAARFLESVTFVVTFTCLRRRSMPEYIVFGIYLVTTLTVIFSVLWWKIFPVCFVEGRGLTLFKIIGEYLVCALLGLALFLFRRNRGRFDRSVYRKLRFALLLAIGSELSFTLYVDVYGVFNLLGHFLKLWSFYLLYEAIVETGIERPYGVFFHELAEANRKLSEEVDARKVTEKHREELIVRLQSALKEIRTLEGIIPICMHCKRIRDDEGYWSQLEEYIHKHSGAEFTHSICPSCLEKYYQTTTDGVDEKKSDENKPS